MTFRTISLEKDGGIARIVLNRPRVLNALSRELCRELDDAVSDVETDPEIKVVIVTGTGERAFSAGADIHEIVRLAEADPATPRVDPASVMSMWHVATCTKPTIGAINGLAYGGGADLACSLDIRVGCEKSSFRFIAASHGDIDSTWNLSMQVGWPVAKELLFTARVVSADEAYRIGLLNYLVSADQLMPKAMDMARQIAAHDADAVQSIKALIVQDVGASWKQRHENMRAALGRLKRVPPGEMFRDFFRTRDRM